MHRLLIEILRLSLGMLDLTDFIERIVVICLSCRYIYLRDRNVYFKTKKKIQKKNKQKR